MQSDWEFLIGTFNYMVVIAQLVRASVCGTEGRGFEPHSPPERSAFAGLFSYTDMGSDPHCRSAALRDAVNRAADRSRFRAPFSTREVSACWPFFVYGCRLCLCACTYPVAELLVMWIKMVGNTPYNVLINRKM